MSQRTGTSRDAAQLQAIATLADAHAPIEPGDDLVAAFARTGAPADFERVVARYAPLVFAECRRVTRDAHDAEDAAQLTFLALAIEVRSGGVALKKPAAWLQRVAQRQASKLVRSRGRRRKREDAARRSDQAPPEPLRLELAERERHAGQVRDAIDELPERYRLPLVLHYFGGLSLEAIGGELNLQRQAVGTRLFRARKMLADRLEARGITMGDALIASVVATLVPAAVVANLMRAGTPVLAQAGPATGFAQGVASLVGLAAARRPATAAAAVAVLSAAASGFAWVAPPAWVEAARATLDPRAWARWIDHLRPAVPTLAPTFVPRAAVAEPDVAPIAVVPRAAAPILLDPPAPAPRTASLVASASAGFDADAGRPATFAPIFGGTLASSATTPPTTTTIVESSIGTGRRATPATTSRREERRTVDRPERQAAGVASFDSLRIGGVGTGAYDVAGGRLRVGGLTLGAGVGSAGTLDLGDGELEVTQPQTPVVVGGRGKGRLYLGTQDAPGRIVASPGADAAMVVRATQQAKGLVSGWGVVESGGTLVNNGRVVADGFERNRTLDLTRFETVTNDLENPRDGTNGWYARRGGRLALPSLRFDAQTPTATWGEDAADATIDLVNSARVTLPGQSRPATVDLALRTVGTLDPLDVPLPSGVTVIGLFDVSASDVDAPAMSFTVRYDHVAAGSILWGELGVRLLAHVGGEWTLADDASLSLLRRTVGGTFASSLDLLAVTIAPPFMAESYGTSGARPSLTGASIDVTPEPGTMLVGVGAAALLGGRRRRRKCETV